MKRHDTDFLSLIPGAILLLVGLAGATNQLQPELTAGRWFLPATLLTLGLIALASSLGRTSAAADIGTDVESGEEAHIE